MNTKTHFNAKYISLIHQHTYLNLKILKSDIIIRFFKNNIPYCAIRNLPLFLSSNAVALQLLKKILAFSIFFMNISYNKRHFFQLRRINKQNSWKSICLIKRTSSKVYF